MFEADGMSTGVDRKRELLERSASIRKALAQERENLRPLTTWLGTMEEMFHKYGPILSTLPTILKAFLQKKEKDSP